MKHRRECVDAGSEFCPCYLAETNDCITCSHLQGKDFCDCNWRGVCIYQEYVMNGNKRKIERGTYEGSIIEKKEIGTNCTVIKVKVTKTLARQLTEPGAYVFLRENGSPQYFDAPMSIMDTDPINGYVYVAYQTLGTKTKRLNNPSKSLLIRGPYWNALLGIKYLKSVRNEKCLVVARGVAQAPAVLVLKKLVKNQNNVTFIVDKGKTNEVFIKEFIDNLNINIIEEDITSQQGINLIKKILGKENIKLVYSGGSDLTHSSIIKTVDQLKINPYLVVTNNTEICCGEGVCGACSTYFEDGEVVKACKAQIDVRQAIERRVLLDD